MSELTERPNVEEIWSWLNEVPDPEIPVISLVDLGIIREVTYEGDTVVVAVTPTYSGCPATQVINADIEAALRARGIKDVRLEQRISPPWTSDWMSESGREKLRAYGIAPPVEEVIDGKKTLWMRSDDKPAVPCPRCSSENTTMVSHFGSTPCKAQYQCKDCLEPFDYFKCI